MEMNASISPFDATLSSMTSEALSLIHASKGKDTTTKVIASSSIQIAVEVKEITAWAKEIDAGVKKIDADLEVIQTAL
jgi:hypothetical protein